MARNMEERIRAMLNADKEMARRKESFENCSRLLQLVILMAQDQLTQGGESSLSSSSRDGVVRVLKEVLLDPSQQDGWRIGLEMHTGLPIGDLGYRSMDQVVRLAISHIDEGMDAVDFLPSLCMARGERAETAENMDKSTAEILRAEAVGKIQNSPFLADLNLWLDWEITFQPVLGALKSFIVNCAEIRSAGDEREDGWRIFEAQLGHFIKVPCAPSPDLEKRFHAAVPLKPLQAAAAAVGIAVKSVGAIDISDSTAACPWLRRLAKHVEKRLQDVNILQAAIFVFSALKSVPQNLLRSIALPLFLQPYLSAKCQEGGIKANAKEEGLLNLCLCYGDYAMLARIGRTIGKSRWGIPEVDPLSLSRMLTIDVDRHHVEYGPSHGSTELHHRVEYAKVEASLKRDGEQSKILDDRNEIRELENHSVSDDQGPGHALNSEKQEFVKVLSGLNSPATISNSEIHPDTSSVSTVKASFCVQFYIVVLWSDAYE